MKSSSCYKLKAVTNLSDRPDCLQDNCNDPCSSVLFGKFTVWSPFCPEHQLFCYICEHIVNRRPEIQEEVEKKFPVNYSRLCNFCLALEVEEMEERKKEHVSKFNNLVYKFEKAEYMVVELRLVAIKYMLKKDSMEHLCQEANKHLSKTNKKKLNKLHTLWKKEPKDRDVDILCFIIKHYRI